MPSSTLPPLSKPAQSIRQQAELHRRETFGVQARTRILIGRDLAHANVDATCAPLSSRQMKEESIRSASTTQKSGASMTLIAHQLACLRQGSGNRWAACRSHLPLINPGSHRARRERGKKSLLTPLPPPLYRGHRRFRHGLNKK